MMRQSRRNTSSRDETNITPKFFDTPVFPSDIWSHIFSMLKLKISYLLIHSSLHSLILSTNIKKKLRKLLVLDDWDDNWRNTIPFSDDYEESVVMESETEFNFIYLAMFEGFKHTYTISPQDIYDVFTRVDGVSELYLDLLVTFNERKFNCFQKFTELQQRGVPLDSVLHCKSLKKVCIDRLSCEPQVLFDMLNVLTEFAVEEVILVNMDITKKITEKERGTLKPNARISDLTLHIREYDRDDQPITNAVLASCVNVKNVELCHVEDISVLAHISSNVEELYVSSSHLDYDLLQRALTRMTKLRSLSLYFEEQLIISPDLWQCIFRLSNLESFFTSQFAFTGAVSGLPSLRQLKELAFASSPTIDQDTLLRLVPSSTLRTLDIDATGDTEESPISRSLDKFNLLENFSCLGVLPSESIQSIIKLNGGSLKLLDLQNTPIDGTLVEVCSNLKQLETLKINLEKGRDLPTLLAMCCKNMSKLSSLTLQITDYTGANNINRPKDIQPLDSLKKLRYQSEEHSLQTVFALANFFPRVIELKVDVSEKNLDLSRFNKAWPNLNTLHLAVEDALDVRRSLRVESVLIISHSFFETDLPLYLQSIVACRECEEFYTSLSLPSIRDDIKVVQDFDHVGKAFYEVLRVNADEKSFAVMRRDLTGIFACTTTHEILSIHREYSAAYRFLILGFVSLMSAAKQPNLDEERGEGDESGDEGRERLANQDFDIQFM